MYTVSTEPETTIFAGIRVWHGHCNVNKREDWFYRVLVFTYMGVVIMINDYEATTPITTDAFVPTLDPKDSAISTLNRLIAICKDGEAGFKEAADNVERADLKGLFIELSTQRSVFVTKLQEVVTSLGGNPSDSGNLSAALHRAWIDVKGAFTGKDEAAALVECERGEDSAKKAYREALDEDLPDFVRSTVQEQYNAVLTAHDRVKALRDIAVPQKSNTARPGVL